MKIDITDDGKVSICGTDKEMMDKALEMVKIITTDFEEGQIFKGKVVSIDVYKRQGERGLPITSALRFSCFSLHAYAR